MTEEDEKEFMVFVMSTGDIQILPYFMTSPTERLRTLPLRESRKHWDSVYLYNTEIAGELIIAEYPPHGFSVNNSESPVIQFNRSLVRDDGLGFGRIWADFTVIDYELDALVPKDPAFVKWYEKIARWLKTRYKRVDVITYAGPGALRFREERGKW